MEQKLENDLKVNFQEIVSLRVMNLKVTNLRVEANYLIQKVPVNLRIKVVDEEDLKEATILDKEIPIWGHKTIILNFKVKDKKVRNSNKVDSNILNNLYEDKITEILNFWIDKAFRISIFIGFVTIVHCDRFYF